MAGLLASCGPIKKSGPDPLLVFSDSSSDHRKDLSSSWPDPKLVVLSVFDVKKKESLKAADKKELARDHFFERYKEQYKNQAIGLEPFDSVNTWFFKQKGSASKYLVKIRIGNFEKIRSLTLKFFNYKFPAESVKTHLVSYDLEKEELEFEVDLSHMATPLSILALNIENFGFEKRGKRSSFLQAQSLVLRRGYRLIIENSKESASFYIDHKLSLRQALSLLDIDRSVDSFGNPLHIYGLRHFSEKVDINNYEDHAGFWKIVNTPSQSLNFTPMPGQAILIKYITMKDLREKVAKREVERFEVSSPFYSPTYRPNSFKWRIKNIQAQVFIPSLAEKKMTGSYKYYDYVDTYRSRVQVLRKKSCQFIQKRAVFKSQKAQAPDILLASPSEKVGLTAVEGALSLNVGLVNGDCKGRHDYRFGLRQKTFMPKYKITGELEQYMKL
ncbi:MAG: hypothetical protein WD025_05285 [Bacteriovoracaceae bacterium]